LLYAEVSDYAAIPSLLQSLLPALKVTSLHCNREYPLNERRRDEAVGDACQELGIHFAIHDDQVLVPPTQLLNKSGQPFKVFTPFARAARDYLAQVPPRAAPSLRTQPKPQLPLHSSLRQLDELSWPETKAE